MAQHPVEYPAPGGSAGGFTRRLDQRDPLARGRIESRQPFPCLVQHRRRGIEKRDMVTDLGQLERLVPGAAAHVQHRRRGSGQVLDELPVQHPRAHEALGRGIGVVGEGARHGRVAEGTGMHAVTLPPQARTASYTEIRRCAGTVTRHDPTER